ncbi:MAG: M23 family metallopeptidase [Bacteroidetes bacterium]|nr:MAG: M23 family metallopeptidase [Bacteroidota bacterium]
MLINLYRRIRAKLTKPYQVDILEYETLKQSRTFVLKPITLVSRGALLFCIIVGGTAALVIFTPAFHRLIPGYIDPEEFRQEREVMETQLAAVEEEVKRWEAYAESFKRLAGVANDSSAPVFNPELLAQNTEASTEAPNEPETSGPFGESGERPGSSTVRTAYVPEPAVPAMKLGRVGPLDALFSPLDGQINNEFDPAKGHYGVDIVAESGALIRAAADGYVTLAEFSDENGWVIGVASAGNVLTYYKHNSRLLKEMGTYVRAGEPVAVIGNTGENSTGMHLHFELWHQGMPLNPVDHLPITP